ncbi:hypothetical protein GGS20DRAFT_502875 [Poronia punctata]|nr:hypothetical protein GGS20DRAFT_502875 [Poronia punctata]
MRFFNVALLAVGFHLSAALPTSSSLRRRVLSPGAINAGHFLNLPHVQSTTARSLDVGKAPGDLTSSPPHKAKAPGQEAPAEGEKEGNDEVDSEGAFDTPIALKGGDLRQDTTFQGTVGKFEVEFQAKDARTLTVTENKTPQGAAPAGFMFLEPSSFKVDLAEGGDGLTFGSADFIYDLNSDGILGVDLSAVKIGKLCTETNTFIIDPAIGEAGFDPVEAETTLKVKNLNGEFALLAPLTSYIGGGDDTSAGDGAGNGADKDAGNGADKDAGNGADKDAGNGAGKDAGDGAGKDDGTGAGDGAGEDDKAGQIEVDGIFGSVNNVDANVFTNLNFPANDAGALEVEYNGTAANSITVVPKMASAPPPEGHLFVDPQTFTITTANPPAAGDKLKVDYKFTAGVKAAIDPAKAITGKFDPATNQFVTTGLGEFEFEADEDEWSLTVTDLNGEWALLVPKSAVL